MNQAPAHTVHHGLERAAHVLSLGVTVADAAGRIVYMNEADTAMHGYAEGELIGSPAHLLGPTGASSTRAPGGPHDVPRWCRHTLNVRKEGEEFPVRLYSEVLFDGRGEPSGRVTLCQDLTADPFREVCRELRGHCGQARPCHDEDVRQDDLTVAIGGIGGAGHGGNGSLWGVERMAALGAWAGGLAHDLRNTLMVIRGSVDLAERSLPPGLSDVSDLLERARGSARESEELVNRLHDVGHHRPLVLDKVDLRHAVQEFATTLSPLLPPTIRLRLEHAPRPPLARADSNAIQQILLNLASNARDAMPDGGTLTLETGLHARRPREGAKRGASEEVHHAAISVTDTGTGMVRETVQRLFEPFFTTKPPGQGTGLGLMMVSALMRAQGGSVHVESEVGTGTRITLLFPLHTE